MTFVFNLRRHWFLADDAFVSFRYAKHLVAGHGLVWNIGEAPVEGYTNFLWTLLMALGMVVSLPPEGLSVALGVISGVGILVSATWFARSRMGAWSPFALVPAALLATNRSFVGWCTGGLETQFFSLLVFLALTRFIREQDDHVRVPLLSALLFSLAALTRPEGLLFVAAPGMLFVIFVLTGKRSPSAFLRWAGLVVLIVGAHFLWRRWYYGFWLPNTYYAKVSGFWWDQGSTYLRLFFHDYALQWFVPWVALYALFKRDTAYLVLLPGIVIHAAYVTYVGGDIFDFRFLVPILPLFYSIVGESCRDLYRTARERFGPRHPYALVALGVPCALVSLAYLRHGAEQPPAIRHGVETIAWTREYARYRIREGMWLKQLVERGVLPADLRYGTGAAGASPYYSELYTLDFLGLNDVQIAHQPIEARGYVAHEKMASPEYLREKRIAMIDTAQGVVYSTPPPRIVVGNPPRFCRPPFKCAKFEGGYLVFETALTDEELHGMLGHLEFLPELPAAAQ